MSGFLDLSKCLSNVHAALTKSQVLPRKNSTVNRTHEGILTCEFLQDLMNKFVHFCVKFQSTKALRETYT